MTIDHIKKFMAENATSFDCGPMIKVNGKTLNTEWSDAKRYRVTVQRILNESTGEFRWAIRDGFGDDLSKSGRWCHTPNLRGRRLNGFRFSTPEEAIRFYFNWRSKQ